MSAPPKMKDKKEEEEEDKISSKEQAQQQEQTLESIDDMFFDPSFDIDSYIKDLPADLTDEFLESHILERDGQLQAVTSKLSSRILGSYDAFVQGMVEVGQLNQDIERTAQLCTIGRSHLLTAKQSLTHTGFRILSQHRKKLIYRDIIGYLEQLSNVEKARNEIEEASREGNFPKAIELCQECLKSLSFLQEFRVVKSLQLDLHEEFEAIQKRMDTVLEDLCRHFDEEKYELVLKGYHLLGRHNRSVVSKIQDYFLKAIPDQTRSVVYAHALQNEELTKDSRPGILKSKTLKDLCSLIPKFAESSFVSCLSHSLAHMTDLMRSHWIISNWHAKHKDVEVGVVGGRGGEGSLSVDSKVHTDIYSDLVRFRKTMWDQMQRDCNKILSAAQLSKYKIDSFLKVLDATDRFTKIGEAFSSSHAPAMYKLMKGKSKAYFSAYHKARLEDLRTMLENEMWIAMPVQANFTLYDIKEFSSFLELSSTTADANALSESVNADAFFQRFENPFSQQQPPQEKQKEEEDDPDVPDELKQEFIDEEGDGSGHPRRRKGGEEEGRGGMMVSDGIESPLLTTTSTNVLKYMGKYLHMIKILQPIAISVFNGFRQIFEYYMYTLYCFFDTTSSAGKQGEIEEVFALNPKLKNTLKRIHLSIYHEGQQEGSDGRPHAALISPMVSEDLRNPQTLFGVSQRAVGIGSLMFMAKSLQLCRSHLENILPSSSQQQQKSIQDFYENYVDSCDELRNYLIYCAARDCLELGDIATQVGTVKWDGKGFIAGGESSYVKVLKRKFNIFAKRMNEAKTNWAVPEKIVLSMWNFAVKIAMYQLVDGYSRARRCTDEGRALMTLDLQTFSSDLKSLCPLTPIPYYSFVENYIKAYFLGKGELVPWVKQQTEYTRSQLVSVTILATAKLPSNVREQLVKLVKEHLKMQR